MRRILLVGTLAAALVAFSAGPAFAAHCVNLSKQEGAGKGIDVILNFVDETVTIVGNGGYADIWGDFDGDGTPDALLEEDVQIGKNHATVAHYGRTFSMDLEPWVNLGAINKVEKGKNEKGMGFHH